MRLTDIVNINQIYGLMQHITTQLLHQFTMALFHIVFMTYRQIYLAKLINSNLPAAFSPMGGPECPHKEKRDSRTSALSWNIYKNLFYRPPPSDYFSLFQYALGLRNFCCSILNYIAMLGSVLQVT